MGPRLGPNPNEPHAGNVLQRQLGLFSLHRACLGIRERVTGHPFWTSSQLRAQWAVMDRGDRRHVILSRKRTHTTTLLGAFAKKQSPGRFLESTRLCVVLLGVVM